MFARVQLWSIEVVICFIELVNPRGLKKANDEPDEPLPKPLHPADGEVGMCVVIQDSETNWRVSEPNAH